MSHKTAATVVHTIGIDTGKNTLHLIGLDDQGAIVLREKIARGRIAARLANVPRCLIGIEPGIAACCARAATGHAATAPPSSVMNSRRRRSSLPRADRRGLFRSRRQRGQNRHGVQRARGIK